MATTTSNSTKVKAVFLLVGSIFMAKLLGFLPELVAAEAK
jgi:hypothetical protein